ncbi:hypothetical protein PG913_01390 [Tenacibaculum pacificus]|uniref:hypothetical protein n=1 Tax=Tenacibaculum pacificus TaxID=3018314 RepID=UPI0022F3FA52|nr:hypothetical protein [Tenacibaculum pacificus]WBX73927.1 hypothetical protein PG913_01390 [Tenacibaculum pacificus]
MKGVISLSEARDYEIIHVKNTRDSEKELKNRFFDIILLYIMIDGESRGISLAHRLNKEHIEMPFLFLTSIQNKIPQLSDNRKIADVLKYFLV